MLKLAPKDTGEVFAAVLAVALDYLKRADPATRPFMSCLVEG